jgi:predicted nucleic acid-binding protein
VATPPAEKNGLGLAHSIVMGEIAMIEGFLTLLPESPTIYPEWKRLVLQYQVTGSKVYDARLVAFANVYRVGSILTFNSADFTRYGSVTALEPASVL